MKTFWGVFYLVLCVFPSLLHAQYGLINALELDQGCRLVQFPATYEPNDEHTAAIEDWSQRSLIEGTQTNGWCSAEKSPFPFVFVFELSEEFVLEKLVFYNQGQKEYKGICAKEVSVEFSTQSPGVGFTEIGRYTLDEYATTTRPIAAQKARWVRLTIYSNYGHAAYTELMEFEAWGKFAVQEVQVSDIIGTWNSNFDWVSVNTTRNGYLYGCYKWQQGSLLSGHISRRQFEFNWSEVQSKRKGWCVMVINQEGNRINGVWGYDDNRSEFGYWEFTRQSPTPQTCWNEAQVKDKIPTVPVLPIVPSLEKEKVEDIIVSSKAQAYVLARLVDDSTGQLITAPAMISCKDLKSFKSQLLAAGRYKFSLPNDSAGNITVQVKGYLPFAYRLYAPSQESVKKMKAVDVELVFRLKVLRVGKSIVLNKILFKQSDFTLLPESYGELDHVVQMMKDFPKMEIELAGHTDNQGDPRKNKILSEQRVESVKDYLVQKGVSASRIRGVGYGGEKPLADNAREETRKLNRRVEFKIIRM